MNKKNNDTFTLLISQAIGSLKMKDIESSKSIISNAIILDVDAPQPQNLLGILYEIKGNDSLARKHYRASYALDPTYTPACHNLERLVMSEWGPLKRDYDYGDVEKENTQTQDYTFDIYSEISQSK